MENKTITSSRPRNGPPFARIFFKVVLIIVQEIRLGSANGGAHDLCFAPGFARTYFRQFTATHYSDRVAEPEELGQIRAHHDHRFARGGEFTHELVDLRFASHVDAAGGFVE